MRAEFTELSDFVKAWSMSIEPACLHGTLTGLVCVGEQLDNTDNWLPVILKERHYSDQEYQLLVREISELYTSIEQQFSQDGFGFQILLPDDDAPLDTRVNAINDWCGGFLETLVEAGEISLQNPPRDFQEVLEEIVNVAGAAIDDHESLEEQEFDFTIIEEHLKTVVQLFYEIQNPLRPEQAPDHLQL